MRAAATAALLLLVLAPLAAADLEQQSGPLFGLPLVPQASCEIEQTAPKPANDGFWQCSLRDVPVQGVLVLRARVLGEGHVIAYADQRTSTPIDRQWGPVECASTITSPYAECAVILSPNGVDGVFDLHAKLDGPGRAVASVHLDAMNISIP